MAGENWSVEEVDLVVADYLEMLAAWCSGQSINKAERRKLLQLKLNGRNDSSVERKRSNISAVVEKLGFHHLPGYKPLQNYQKLLESVVAQRIVRAPWLDQAELAASELPAVPHAGIDFSKVKAAAPKLSPQVGESEPQYLPIRRDYVEREARNRSLGRAGEEFVVEFERWRLEKLGESKLASQVDWVSTTKGDGLGYDVLSFESDGVPRHIEVKTTAFGVATPFFLTSNELKFAKSQEASFQLYRVFEFRQQPRLFFLPGSPDAHCILDPVSYRASFS
jgi:hypothetical protein